jgi:hypothetical protein
LATISSGLCLFLLILPSTIGSKAIHHRKDHFSGGRLCIDPRMLPNLGILKCDCGGLPDRSNDELAPAKPAIQPASRSKWAAPETRQPPTPLLSQTTASLTKSHGCTAQSLIH